MLGLVIELVLDLELNLDHWILKWIRCSLPTKKGEKCGK